MKYSFKFRHALNSSKTILKTKMETVELIFLSYKYLLIYFLYKSAASFVHSPPCPGPQDVNLMRCSFLAVSTEPTHNTFWWLSLSPSLSPCRFPLPLFLTEVHFPIFFSFKYYTKPFTLDVSIQKAYNEVISFII